MAWHAASQQSFSRCEWLRLSFYHQKKLGYLRNLSLYMPFVVGYPFLEFLSGIEFYEPPSLEFFSGTG